VRFFTGLGVLYGLPILVLIVGAFILNKYKKIKTALLLVLTAAIGQWLSFFLWFVSRHSITANEATRQWGLNLPSVAKAGFPISALEIPPSPMGSDNIPVDMWGGVFTNNLIWFVVAFVVAAIIVSRLKKPGKKFLIVCTVLAVLALIYNLALFTFWYD
jgi:hypothetical protein